MSSEAFFWIAGIFAVIVGAIGAALWSHIVEDGKVRERLASLESDTATIKEEVKGLRKHWHDFQDGTMRDVYDLFQKWKNEVLDLFRRNKE